jgi:hypothetical protein
MIFVDKGELTTTLPTIPGAVPLDNLEEQSGADLMVSPLSIPAVTLTLLKRHVQAGAYLVQGKWSVGDLTASLQDDRMNASLAKMCELDTTAAQRVLLYVGQPPPPDTPEYAALSKWADRGGRVEPPLPGLSWVGSWCRMKEKHLAEYRVEPIRWVYDNQKDFKSQPEDDPLQLLARVPTNDPRRLLVNLDGVGPVLAQRWWEWGNTNPAECDATFLGIVAHMTCVGKGCEKVLGWGPGKAQRVREHLGLPDGLDFRAYWLAVVKDKRDGWKPAESPTMWETPY